MTMYSPIPVNNGSYLYKFLRYGETRTRKSLIPPNGGVGSGWGNQTMGNYMHGIVRKQPPEFQGAVFL